MSERMDRIREVLTAAFDPVSLELIDDSSKHAGHTGNKDGGGHYQVVIVSALFSGKSPIQRHRMVYDAMGDIMKNEIHALSIKAFTPEQAG